MYLSVVRSFDLQRAARLSKPHPATYSIMPKNVATTPLKAKI
jgi:hypothetical protein